MNSIQIILATLVLAWIAYKVVRVVASILLRVALFIIIAIIIGIMLWKYSGQ